MNFKTNGKLYITGEYNVLNSKGNALIYGLNKYISFEIKSSDKYTYEEKKQILNFSYDNEALDFINDTNDNLVKETIKTTFEYLRLKEILVVPFSLKADSNLETNEGIKYGFGSSAAIMTGIIKSILNFHNLALEDKTIYKLGVITQFRLNKVSSGGDLASSLHEGVIYYQRYNLKWFNKADKTVSLVDKKWPGLKIIKINKPLNVAAIWTKKPYKTNALTNEITKEQFKVSKTLVKKTANNLIKKNYIKFKENILEYQVWLEEILKNDNLYIDELKKSFELARKYNLAAKISGAGGGDCLIAFYPSGFNFNNLEKELKQNDLELFLFEGAL